MVLFHNLLVSIPNFTVIDLMKNIEPCGIPFYKPIYIIEAHDFDYKVNYATLHKNK